MKPVVIGMAGGSGAGKTSIAQQLIDRLGDDVIAWLPYDAYYADLSHLEFSQRVQCNFDHPDAFDTTLFMAHIDALCSGQHVTMPTYDFVSYTRVTGTQVVYPRPILLLDGILLFVHASLRSRMQMRIYIDAPDDIRLIRRILRDTQSRGRDIASICQQYMQTVRPMHQQFVEPSRMHAHVIIPSINDVTPAVDLLTNHIRQLLL